MFCPSFANSLSLPSKQRAQGMPGARCTRGLVCQEIAHWRTRAYRAAENTPTSPAQWLYGLLRALPGDEFLLSPSSANWQLRWPGWANFASADLASATDARTTQLHRTQPRRSSRVPFDRSRGSSRPAISSTHDAAASTASHPNLGDDGQRPSSGMRWPNL